MIGLGRYQKRKVADFCQIERAKKGKIYPKGSLFVKLSATDETVGQLNEDGEIETRFAVIIPPSGEEADYLRAAVEEAFPDFLQRYRTTINLNYQELEHLEILWHTEKETRDYVVRAIRYMDDNITKTEKEIQSTQEIKRWYLAKMMI